jgi:hypothetical protein
MARAYMQLSTTVGCKLLQEQIGFLSHDPSFSYWNQICSKGEILNGETFIILAPQSKCFCHHIRYCLLYTLSSCVSNGSLVWRYMYCLVLLMLKTTDLSLRCFRL